MIGKIEATEDPQVLHIAASYGGKTLSGTMSAEALFSFVQRTFDEVELVEARRKVAEIESRLKIESTALRVERHVHTELDETDAGAGVSEDTSSTPANDLMAELHAIKQRNLERRRRRA